MKSARFQIPGETELKVSKSGQAFPACNYEWGTDLVVRTIQAGGRDIEVKEPAKVVLVVATDVTADNFQTSTAVYRDPQDVAGIGDMARWDDGSPSSASGRRRPVPHQRQGQLRQGGKPPPGRGRGPEAAAETAVRLPALHRQPQAGRTGRRVYGACPAQGRA